MITHQQCKQNVKKHLRNSISKYQQNCQTQNCCFSQKSRFYVNMVWPLANGVVTSTPRVWVDIMITHQQYKQNVKKHLRNSISKYQQNCQTQNCCFSQKSRFYVNMVWPLANGVLTSTPRVWLDIMITHQQCKQNVKKHLRNSISKYQQNCQTQNCCFSQKSRFYVNMVWPLANGVVTSTPRVWVDIMITHQQYKQNVKKHLRNSISKYQQNCQTQNCCFSQKSRFYVNMVWSLANGVVTSTPRVWVDIMITHQQCKQNVKKHLRNSISKYQQNCQTQNCCFSQKSRFYVNMVWPLANGVVTSTPRVWVDIMITHQQCKQNVKKHLQNSISKYQQNCQTQNRCFSQKSRFYVNMVWSLANGVVTSTPRVWVDIMITHQQCKQNVKKHLRNSISKYQQNCQTQNCCFSQKSRFYVNIVWSLANGVVTSTPRVWVDIMITHQQCKQNVKKHLRNSISKYQQNCQTQNCCFSQKSRFYVNIVWSLANGVVTSTPRVWVDIMITHP